MKGVVSSDDLVKILSEDFPDLTINNIRYIDEGFGSWVYLINDNLCFRFSKGAFSSSLTEHGYAIHKQLKKIVILPKACEIALPICARPASSRYPYFYSCHAYMPGKKLDYQQFSKLSCRQCDVVLKKICHFLNRLHQSCLDNSLTVCSLHQWRPFHALREVTLSTTKQYLNENLQRRCCEIYDRFLEISRIDFQPHYLLHGDLTGDNIIYDSSGKLVFLDFDRVCIGEKAFDLFRIIQSYGYSVFDRASQYLGIADDRYLRDKIQFYLLFECVNFLKPDPDKFGVYEKKLRASAQWSLQNLLMGSDEVIADFKSIMGSKV